jgi:TonB family protein
VNVEAPLVAEGMISNQAVRGDTTGARIRALESGTSEAYLQGDDGKGTLWGGSVDCMKDPVCLEYLNMIRDRVFRRWAIPPQTDAGKVVLAFRIDRGGAAHGVKVRSADDAVLGQTCEAAFRHASPFPPPPEKIRYIVNKGIKATFRYGE